jgi:hypothetical protein
MAFTDFTDLLYPNLKPEGVVGPGTSTTGTDLQGYQEVWISDHEDMEKVLDVSFAF